MRQFNRILGLAVCAALLSLAAFSPAKAQEDAFSAGQKKEIESIIRDYLTSNPDVIIEAVQNYQNNQQSAQQRQQEQGAKALTGKRENDHLYGDPGAPITLIEYSDFECPYCKRFHPSARALVDESNGQVNWIYRHLPLPMHSGAMPKALASECAYAQGGDKAFWDFADAFLERSVPVSGLEKLAKDTGLDEQKFQACLDGKEHQDRVQQNMTEAGSAGITGTPGNIIVNNKTQKLSVIPGALPLSSLKKEVQKLQN